MSKKFLLNAIPIPIDWLFYQNKFSSTENKIQTMKVKTSSVPIMLLISKHNKKHKTGAGLKLYKIIGSALFDTRLCSCPLLSYSREYKDIS